MACPDEDEIVAYAQGHLGPSARARIAAHVDACPACVGLVAEAARAADTRMHGATSHGVGEIVPGRGTSLGRYLVLELLGAGGLGRVYSAYDPELDRRVAIKLLAPLALASGSAELRARLVREAQALAKVRHPNVVAVHDVGVVDEQVFVAMELVEGTTLRGWLQERPRTWSEIREVFVAAARGLVAVHDAGLVHRDVKPGNVLIGRDDRVQVADFGLARALDREGEPGGERRQRALELVPSALDEALTLSGAVMGTPAYMAPEQHRGERVDARADQFGFCVALFEALYGARPFEGQTREELFAAAIAGVVVDVPGRGVPGWLRRVVMRGLAPELADRFASMHELAAALESDRRTRRRKLAIGALALVLGGAGLWGGVIAPALAPAATAEDAVDALATEARALAAKAHFVHPPAEDPAQPTAYTKVLELEAIAGARAQAADARAAELREEFTTTLVRLGDRYWDEPGGAPFAAEYYAAALVFDSDHARALERVGLPIAAMAALRERAATLAFTEPELVAVAPVIAWATDDIAVRARRLQAVYARTPEPPATITAALEILLGEQARTAVTQGRAQRGLIAAAPREVEGSPVKDAPRVPDPQSATTPPGATGKPTAIKPATSDASPTVATGDRKTAQALATAGKAALRRGDLAEAESAFHRALAADREDVGALAGLGEVYFQRRAYDKSARFFERAVALRSEDGGLHIDLGDVYFKVLRYKDARAQYVAAQKLGHGGAAKRLQRLDERLGEKAGP